MKTNKIFQLLDRQPQYERPSLLFQKAWMLFCLLIGISFLSKAQIILNERVCDLNIPKSEFTNNVHRAPDSDDFCNTGTKIFNEILEGESLVSSVQAIRLDDGSNVAHRVKLVVNWNANSVGVLKVKISFIKRKYAPTLLNPGRCIDEGGDLYTYEIEKGYISPEGTLTGQSEIVSSVPRAQIRLGYEEAPGFPGEITRVNYTIKNEANQTVAISSFDPTKSDITYTTSAYGSYLVETQTQIACNNIFLPGPSKTIKVVPSCVNDVIAFPNVTGPQLQVYEDGFRVEKGFDYRLSMNGVTDFPNHYRVVQNGGDQIDYTENENGTIDFSVLRPLSSYSFSFPREDNLGSDNCLTLPVVDVFVGGADTTLLLDCPVALPEDLSLEFGYRPEDDPKGLVLQHFDATVKSKRQIVVKPGIVLESGATLTLLF
ncbi:MAG: hypothetical protein AAGA66_20165, partial [Bacteroidota bacterium]